MNAFLVLREGATRELALSLSAAIWDLCRHPTMPGPITHWCAVLEHPGTAEVALVVPATPVYVQPTCNPSPLLAMLAPLAEPAVIAGLATMLDERKGSAIHAQFVLPAVLGSPLKSAEEMIADGWWSESNA